MTLCSPNHYYALTGADRRYEHAYARHAFARERVAVVESAVSHGDRLVEIAGRVRSLSSLPTKGPAGISQDTFVAGTRFLGVMANGQLRFALYDEGGALKVAADRALTAASTPEQVPVVPRDGAIEAIQRPNQRPRLRLPRRIRGANCQPEGRIAGRQVEAGLADRLHAQDHTYAELLYITFYEPSTERVARERNVPVARVREMLSGLPTHAHHEFDFLGPQLYRRSDIDAMAPYGVLEPPTDPREPSAYEPDLLR